MERASWTLWAKLASGWTNISADVKGNTYAEWGLGGNKPTDLIAHTGTLEFDLDNHTVPGKYSPNHASAVAGWKKGTPIHVVFAYEDTSYIRFRGYLDSFSNAGSKDEFKHIVAVDWLDYAARHPIVNPGLLTNQSAGQTLETTLALMPIQPTATDFEASSSTFPTTFDTTTSTTTAYDEFVKVAFSELGPIYLKKDKVNGETLVLENAFHRHGWSAATELPLGTDTAGFLLKQDSGKILNADGEGAILLSQLGELHLNDSANVLDYETEDGENIINRFTVYALPRRVDASPVILFQLDDPLEIASNQTLVIKGTYANPEGGLPVNAKNMITPVITTDYLVNTLSDGTGTNISANLTLVSISYGTEGFTHSVKNGSGNPGYITKFNCRGYGIYIYNPIEHTATDSASIAEFGTQSDSITQKYKNGLGFGSLFANTVVENEKEPRTVLNRVYMSANKSGSAMMAFLNLDIGDMVRITNALENIDRYFYIQSVRYETRPAGIIFYDWIVKETLTYNLGLDDFAIEFKGGSSEDGVSFGWVPYITSNYLERSFSAWIYVDVAPVGTGDAILDVFSDEAGFLSTVTTSREISYYTKQAGGVASWETPVNSVPLTTWTHVAITRDATDFDADPTTPPKIYINGTLQTLTITLVSVGLPNSESGVPFVIGNVDTAALDWTRAFDGKIKDVRVYDNILTQAEVTTLYNAGTPDPTLLVSPSADGLMFQAFAVKTEKLDDYIDATLTSTMKVRDGVNSVIGTPHGTPIGRTA